MSKVSVDEVLKVARLARITLSDGEIVNAVQDLSNIFEQFSEIQAISTDGVPTSDDVTGMTNVVREDVSDQGDLAEPASLLDAAPLVKDGHVQVKSVFDA